jgi:glycerol-3-phosphate acyltransferase PlsX
MPRLILDAMGGDFAPVATIEGALKALPELERDRDGELVLLGDEAVIRKLLEKRKYRALAEAVARKTPGQYKVTIVHAPDSIDMADSIRAVRNKPNASINVGCKMAGEDYANRSPEITGPKQPS